VTGADPQFISSAANALVKDLRRLAQESTAYRKQERIWLEGDHLCRAALQRGVKPSITVVREAAWQEHAAEFGHVAGKTVILADALFDALSGLESPARIGFVLPLPVSPAVQPGTPSIVLDGLQDAGNVGTILRSAAAFGFSQVLSIKGTAALWSPKVLRAGMGAHFALRLVEGVSASDVQALAIPLLATSSHRGDLLHEARLPWPCAWLMGHEGQGVGAELTAIATQHVRIAQPGGEESLNVSAAAAICMHASATAARVHARG
jgi:TrmH family RNA methyltransferase